MVGSMGDLTLVEAMEALKAQATQWFAELGEEDGHS
jgi:hypothetical protein